MIGGKRALIPAIYGVSYYHCALTPTYRLAGGRPSLMGAVDLLAARAILRRRETLAAPPKAMGDVSLRQTLLYYNYNYYYTTTSPPGELLLYCHSTTIILLLYYYCTTTLLPGKLLLYYHYTTTSRPGTRLQ